MKSHWKSSENPLYVRVIWKKGVRHAILYNEDIQKKQKHGSSTPKKEEKSSTSNETNLDTCLTKLKLDNKEHNLPARAVSCEPTFICNPLCKVITKPTYLKQSYYYISNLHEPSTPCNASENCTQDAFTERILQWLNSSTGIDFIPCLEEIKNQKKTVKERPKTSPGINNSKINVRENSESIIEEENESVIQCGRAQLHVFIPIFENDRSQCIKKSKSLDVS